MERDDRILLVLPLHHVHGIVNVLCCALWRRRALRDPADVRRRRACGSGSRRRAHAVHGGADIYCRLIAGLRRSADAGLQRGAGGAAAAGCG